INDRISDERVLRDRRGTELEIQVRMRVGTSERNAPLPLPTERGPYRCDVPGRQGLVYLASQDALRISPQGPLHCGQHLPALFELPPGMQRQQVGELLGSRVQRALAVPCAFTGVTHGLDKHDLILIAHDPWSLREVLNELADEEVLSWVLTPPRTVAHDVSVQLLQQLGVRHDDGVLPSACQEMAYVPDAQQHHDALSSATRAVREVTLITVAVTVRPLVVLNDNACAFAAEHDVSDVPTKVLGARGIDLLGHAVAGGRQLAFRGELTIDMFDKELLERVAQVVGSVNGQ